jgi:hypothetical protein
MADTIRVVALVALLNISFSVNAAEAWLQYKSTPDQAQAGALIDSGVLEDSIAFINETFTLQRDIAVVVGAEEGPLYDPAISEIQIPYPFYTEVIERISALESGVEAQELFAADAMLHTLFHEFGHALVDQLDIPVVGKEEDAVDGLASMLLLEYYEEGASIAANAAELFALEGEERGEPGEADFWDEHSLDEQRYYSTLCHIVGSDPVEYKPLAAEIGFSDDRVEICEATYQQLVSDWETLLEEALDP